MATYATPHAEPVSTRVDSAAPQSSHANLSQPLPTTVSRPATVAYVPPSAVLSGHHHTPLQPNRHHPLPDTSWHDHHTRLKNNHIPPPRLPLPSSQPSQVQAHHSKVEKSSNLDSQSLHHSRTQYHGHGRPHHIRDAPRETAHSYHHTVNVVAPPHSDSRLSAPTHHTSYLYPVHQLVTPVAHVPIGAAHYAHLPPSIWSPPHPQYHHQHGHPHTHQLSPAHHVGSAVVSPAHGQVPFAAPHVHHVAAPTHAPSHAYTLPGPHATTTPHPPRPGPPHAVHPTPHHAQQHITYTYTHVPTAPPTHHAVKTVSVSPSQSIAVGGPLRYTMSSSQVPHAIEGTAVSAPMPCKVDAVQPHASHSEQPPPSHSNGIHTGEGSKPYHQMNGKGRNTTRLSNGIDDHTDASSPSLAKSHSHHTDGIPAYGKGNEQDKTPSHKEKAQLNPGQPIRKPRKPYTIKKSREVWTQEEHSRFLQALRLYDRDWKRIEAYIGTKTVLQIRSHAQKHFGKVTKYKTGEYIPPPRPKKRAALPYPTSRSTGQSKPHGANESASSTAAAAGCAAHSDSDPNAKNRDGGSKYVTDGKLGNLGSPQMNLAGNRNSQGTIRNGMEPNSHGPTSKLPTMTTVQASERQSGPASYADNCSPKPYERQNDVRSQQSVPHNKLALENPLTRWRPAPLSSKEPCLEEGRGLPRASSSSADTKTGTTSYVNDSHVHSRRSLSYSEGSCQRDTQSNREYHHRSVEVLPGSENNPMSQTMIRRSPKRLPSNHSVERDGCIVNEASRKKIAMPNNSLLVLSNCVDLMSRNALPERQPAAGWATAAAARRAHRAKIIRARKPPLPHPPSTATGEDPAHGCKESSRGEVLDSDTLDEQSSRHTRDQDTALKNASSRIGSRSPSVNSPAEYGCEQPPPDPQRSSAGSGTGSDDAIAGFSSSDRPSISGSAAGSGTGGSPETSDAGDPEEDPKSSNDGSGDDGNRRSPPTRDSSPVDPNSSGSRENSPNECSTAQPSNVRNQSLLDSTVQKASEENGVSHEDKCMRVVIGSRHRHEGSQNERFVRHLDNEGKAVAKQDDDKPHELRRTAPTASNDDCALLRSRPERVDHGSQLHHYIASKFPASDKKRIRSDIEFDSNGRTDGQTVEDGRDPEPKRHRMEHSTKEANCRSDGTYVSRASAERSR